MKGGLGELLPSRAFARRMHELETELQQARMQLRRVSKSPGATTRWGLEPPPVPQQEEGWFITYLDMMTLLLVVMIVMLAYSGTLGERAGTPPQEPDTMTMAAGSGPSKPPTPAASSQTAAAADDATPAIQAGKKPAAAAPASSPEPATTPASAATYTTEAATSAPAPAPPSPEVSPAPPEAPGKPPASAAAAADVPPAIPATGNGIAPSPRAAVATTNPATVAASGSGLLPAGAGLLPGRGHVADAAAVSETYPGWAMGAGMPAHPADIGPLPRPAAAARTEGHAPPSIARTADTLYPGWGATDLAASFIGPPRPESRVIAAPAIAEDDPPSEGEQLAADLPLGELGQDIEVIVSERSVSFRVNSEILFDSSQAGLSRSGLAILRNIVRVLTRAGYDVTVEGHTDAVPVRRNVRYPSNWELSSARAGSVVRYLQANGIDRAHLKAVGYADTRPIADNDTPEGRARNRRVELVIEKRP